MCAASIAPILAGTMLCFEVLRRRDDLEDLGEERRTFFRMNHLQGATSYFPDHSKALGLMPYFNDSEDCNAYVTELTNGGVVVWVTTPRFSSVDLRSAERNTTSGSSPSLERMAASSESSGSLNATALDGASHAPLGAENRTGSSLTRR